MDASALRAMCEPIEVDTIEEAEARDAEWQAAIAANERLMEEMKLRRGDKNHVNPSLLRQ